MATPIELCWICKEDVRLFNIPLMTDTPVCKPCASEWRDGAATPEEILLRRGKAAK